MKEQSIEELIYSETEQRLKQMESPDYDFPEQIDKRDWAVIWGSIGISLLLIVLCMTGVIS